jgi:hypothetical protein
MRFSPGDPKKGMEDINSARHVADLANVMCKP